MKGYFVSKKKAATKKKPLGKKKLPPSRSLGINIPGDEALVKTTKTTAASKLNRCGFCCTKGVICAEGTAVPPVGGLSLLRVVARVYRLHETVPSPNDPPTDANTKVAQTNGNLDWHFEAIPNAECAPDEPGNSDNKLCLWYVWDHGNPTPGLQEFRGICSGHTDCDE
jgi:hypothetical protein